eukprot:scaffold54239_cov78-Phaeocystis_antarctica.AAC.2
MAEAAVAALLSPPAASCAMALTSSRSRMCATAYSSHRCFASPLPSREERRKAAGTDSDDAWTSLADDLGVIRRAELACFELLLHARTSEAASLLLPTYLHCPDKPRIRGSSTYLPTGYLERPGVRATYLTPLGDKIDRAAKAERVAAASWRRRWRG